jgi:molybdate transport system ATP-binding protein
MQRCGTPRRNLAQRWLTALGLGRLAQAPLAALSEGQQRLVLLGRALIKSPQLLILDEPCQGLDRRSREVILAVIDKVVSRGTTTVLYVTHDLRELPRCITHRLALESGRIVSCGSLTDRQGSLKSS